MSIVDVFRPKWRHSDPAVRLLAVRQLLDFDTLARIARTDDDSDVRAAAAERISGLSTLADILQVDDEPRVRIAALTNVMDQHLLCRVATEDKDKSVRLAATRRITTEEGLQTLFSSRAAEEPVRAAALERMTDQNFLRAIAQQLDEKQALRLVAIARLNDQVPLVEVAMREADSVVRLAAIARLNDQIPLVELAMREADSVVRLAAIARISDQAALLEIAKGNTDPVIRIAAGRKIADQTAFQEIADSEPNPETKTKFTAALLEKRLMEGPLQEFKDIRDQIVRNMHQPVILDAIVAKLEPLLKNLSRDCRKLVSTILSERSSAYEDIEYYEEEVDASARKAILFDPENWRALLSLARLAIVHREIDEAMTTLQSALALTAGDRAAQSIVLSGAIEAFKKVTKPNPSSAWADAYEKGWRMLVMLGEQAIVLGHGTEGFGVFELALRWASVVPNFVGTRAVLAAMNEVGLGSVLARRMMDQVLGGQTR